MIISKLQGGLGNQLFQYAYGRALSNKNNIELYLDISWYKGRIDRKYILDRFNIEAKIANRFDVFKTRLLSPSNYIIGDYQSEKYFKDIENIIRKEFVLKDEISDKYKDIIEKMKSHNSVSIHLRGGDYVLGKKSGFHGMCSPEYYREAINTMKNRVVDVHFFIFTDDIKWAEKHIDFPNPHTLVSDTSSRPEKELILMSLCKHNIIANSTFSWWGAWLNNNKDKIIIAPKKWFSNEKIDTSDILPSTWIKI